MTTDESLWKMEEHFWTDGADAARSLMADGAVMVFPYPSGILQGDEIADGMEAAPRWRSVIMTDRRLRRQDNVAVLAYQASAERSGSDLYRALCASTYVNDEGNWRLVSHQQTPAG